LIETIILSVVAWEILRRLVLLGCRDAPEGSLRERIGVLLVGGGPRPKR
jgi:hypothetical protein